MSTELRAAVAAVAAAARDDHDPNIGPATRAALEALTSATGPGERDERQRLLAAEVELCDAPVGAGIMALVIGAGVEDGDSPGQSVRQVAAAFRRWCEQATETDAEAAAGVTFLAQSLVAHLLRDDDARVALGQDAGFMEALDETEANSPGPFWVRHVLDQRSGSLVVLHGTEPAGVHVAYENVASNFQLFGLLQRELAGRFPGARAEAPPPDADENEAWWHYGSPLSPEPGAMSMIWGEMTPDSIPVVEGRQVLLLWDPVMQGRSWSGFGGAVIEAAPPSVRIEGRLTDDEVRFWRQRLGLP